MSHYSGIHRYQIPMWPGYSITAHAAQGATIEPCIIDLTDVSGSTTIDHASNYVLLSRVTALKNLLILREFDLNVMKPTFKTDMWKEWQRLIALSTKTNVKYKNLFEQKSLAPNTVDPSVPGKTIQFYIKEEKIFKDIETGLKTIEIRALTERLKKQDINVHDSSV